METDQEAEGSCGIRNWFLPSFHRRAKLGDLSLSHLGGQSSDLGGAGGEANVCAGLRQAGRSLRSVQRSFPLQPRAVVQADVLLGLMVFHSGPSPRAGLEQGSELPRSWASGAFTDPGLSEGVYL